MPVTHAIEGRILVLTMAGVYTTTDLRNALDAALDTLSDVAPDGLMFDLRGSNSLEHRSAEDVIAMARFLASRSPRFGRRLAMVAPTDLAFGLMRLGAVIAESGGVEAVVFRSLGEAREWLNGASQDDEPDRGRLGSSP